MPTETIIGDGDGTYTDWLNNGEAQDYLCVDDDNGDTSFISKETPANSATTVDRTTGLNQPTANIITRVEVFSKNRYTTGTAPNFVHRCYKSAVFDFDGATKTTTGSYALYSNDFTSDRSWAPGDIDSSFEFGVEITTTTGNQRCTYLYCEIDWEAGGSFISAWEWIPPLLASGLFGNYLFAESTEKLHAIIGSILKRNKITSRPLFKEVKEVINAITLRPRFVFLGEN